MQKYVKTHVNRVDLVKGFKTSILIYLQTSASIQPRTRRSKFAGISYLLHPPRSSIPLCKLPSPHACAMRPFAISSTLSITPLTIRSVSEHAGASSSANSMAKDALHSPGSLRISASMTAPQASLRPTLEQTCDQWFAATVPTSSTWGICTRKEGRQCSFSAVSKPNFTSKYTCESSRRDLHNTLLCTACTAFGIHNRKVGKKDLAKTTPKKEKARKRAHTRSSEKLRERKSRRVELRATDEVERIDPTLCSWVREMSLGADFVCGLSRR